MNSREMRNSPFRWLHPIHARGVRSPNLPVTLGRLTDRKITQYARDGRYGVEAQARALVKPKKKKRLTLVQVLRILGGQE